VHYDNEVKISLQKHQPCTQTATFPLRLHYLCKFLSR